MPEYNCTYIPNIIDNKLGTKLQIKKPENKKHLQRKSRAKIESQNGMARRINIMDSNSPQI